MAAAPEESGAGRREAPCSGALGGLRGQKAALGNEKLNNVSNYNRTGRWAAAEALSRLPFPSGGSARPHPLRRCCSPQGTWFPQQGGRSCPERSLISCLMI